ncbi:MAG: LuxR C-terminal-related transcriptional regulator [Chloroflexota bacterium]
MSTPILATKLYIPSVRATLVLRPRLIARLNKGRHGKLTLISAPAGFGKTTLASEWAASGEWPVAWLSLDERDNDPTRFVAYLIEALQTIAAQVGTAAIGEGVLELLHSPQSPSVESMLTALLNEITTLSNRFILVLDDYHVLNNDVVNEAIAFFIEHLPPLMHLVITSRQDPPLPLARYRVRGQLTEVRDSDLRFTPDEAARFLNDAMGLTLSVEEITALESRTEGWIAGLQMAALALQRSSDLLDQSGNTHFIQAFTGSHRFVLDYLVEEVLQRQPEKVRSFLLQTAILERLNGSLCEAVTGQEDGKGMLEALDRGNLFVVPLDDARQWYRYHHLFAEVLQIRLKEEQPTELSNLHERASEWYEQRSLPTDAIHHALVAEDFSRAAGLIEVVWPTMRKNRQDATTLGWVKALPDRVIRARPVLSVLYAWTLLDSNKLEDVEARLQDAERLLYSRSEMNKGGGTPDSLQPPPARTNAAEMDSGEMTSAEIVVVDDVQFRSLQGSIANARAYHAQTRGDVLSAITYAQRALELLPASDHYEHGTAAALLGLAYWSSGELEAAYRFFADGLESLQIGGGILSAIGGTSILAYIRVAQGRLKEAVRIYTQSLQLAAKQDEPLPLATADLYRGLSEIYREWDELETATQHLQRSKELGKLAATPSDKYHRLVAEARLKEAQGHVEDALDLIYQAEQLYYTIPIPDIYPVGALKVRLWVRQARVADALEWVRERGLSIDDDLNYLSEFAHVTFARVLLLQNQSKQALALLERLLQAAEKGGRRGTVIEILILQSLAHQIQGNTSAALTVLEQALTLAEPEGYVRIFVNEGPPMAQLLHKAEARGIVPNYTTKLLAAFKPVQPEIANTALVTQASQQLIEPLSQRELDVLRLLKTELSGPEIAHELVVALSTVRTHTKRIYGKLDVKNRRAAVKRAEELGLI